MILLLALAIRFGKQNTNNVPLAIKISYKKLEALNKLENDFNLKRLESQIESAPNEVSYYIDYSKLYKLQQFIENQEEFKLTGIPSEPITHNHRFISDKYLKSYKDDNLTFIFLNDAVSIMLLAIKNKELILPLNQKVKFLALTYRILNLIKWNSKFSYYKSLLLLNMFEIFGAELLLRENNSEDINEIKGSAIFKQYKAYKIMLAEGEIKSP